MKKLFVKLNCFFAVFPLVFALLFFGLMPVKYEAVLYTDHVEGEGICVTHLCEAESFSPFYEVAFYFGSELKKANIVGYPYNVKNISLNISDVSRFDITSLDAYVWGIHVKHYDGNQIMTTSDRVETDAAVFENRDNVFHVEVTDPKKGVSFDLHKEMIPKAFWVVYFAVVLTASLLLALLVETLSQRWSFLPRFLAGISGVLTALLAGQFFCGSLPYAASLSSLLNWLLLYALSLLVGALTLPWLGTVLTMGFTLFWYVANYFVILYRSKPIMPSDLKAIGTAKEVMGSYSFAPGWQLVLGAVVTVAYAVGVVLVSRKKTGEPEEKRSGLKQQLLRRGAGLICAAVFLFAGTHNPVFASVNDFQWDGAVMKSFHKDGMVLTFLNSALSAGVKMPEGYSKEAVEDYLAEYQAAQTEPVTGTQPTRIIMVMDEAFSDLRTVGLDSRVDVMPFIDSLDKNTVEGSLYVSIFGGGTCNTEFEALTGNTLAFLGAGAYPYTENVTKPLFSLASYFKERGYLTEAFHANEAQNWNRVNVYPNLGFDTFHSIEDYPPFSEETWLHEHPADLADYRYMAQVDEENRDKPRFLFNVTMQNHSGYERWEDVEEAESVKKYVPDLYMDTRVYLSLVKASDEAVKELVETYRDSDEPTMIVYFGDHQPGLPGVAQNEIYTAMDSYLDVFQSKFFIWTNYETEEQHEVKISANYLPWLILERGNFPLPPYVRMLKELHEQYPVISAQGVMDRDGELYYSVDALADDPLIQKYRYIQYANLYDEISPDWFTVN